MAVSEIVVDLKDRLPRGTADSGRTLDLMGDHMTPMEAYLMAVASCTVLDVHDILRKMRVDASLQVRVRAEKADHHPKVLTRIDLVFVVTGKDVPYEKVLRAVELSQKRYCGVGIMAKQACPVSYAIELHEVEGA